MLGNNICSNKFKRIYLPLLRDSDTSANITGRYYFSEQPEIEKHFITGLQVNFGGEDITQTAGFLLGKSAINLPPVGTVQNIYVTIYDNNDIEKITQFPVVPLANIASFKLGKIIPVYGKINLKKSYVNIVGVIPAGATISGLSFTFYYI